MVLLPSDSSLGSDTHSGGVSGGDAWVLSVACGSDMRGKHSFPHSVLYLYSRAGQGPQSSRRFLSAPREMGTSWDVPSSILCSCTDTGDYPALLLGLPAERAHVRKRKGQPDTAQDMLLSKTRGKTPYRAGSQGI